MPLKIGIGIGVVEGGVTSPPPSLALTGTATGGITAANIVSGGKVITETLTTDTWLPAMVGLPEPVFNVGTETMVLQDDFSGSRYANLTAMGATSSSPGFYPYPSPEINSTAVDATKNAIVTPGPISGQALRLPWPGGAAQATRSVFVWNCFGAAGPSVTHYYQYYFRVICNGFDPGVTVIAVKWFEIWPSPGSVDRTQFNTHTANPGPPGPFATMLQVYSQSQATAGQGDQPVGPYLTLAQLCDGNWHRVTYAHKAQTTTGSRDGFEQMWIDGQMVINISQAAVGVTPSGGDRAWCGQDDVDAVMNVTTNSITNSSNYLVIGDVQTTNTPDWTLDIGNFSWWHS